SRTPSPKEPRCQRRRGPPLAARRPAVAPAPTGGIPNMGWRPDVRSLVADGGAPALGRDHRTAATAPAGCELPPCLTLSVRRSLESELRTRGRWLRTCIHGDGGREAPRQGARSRTLRRDRPDRPKAGAGRAASPRRDPKPCPRRRPPFAELAVCPDPGESGPRSTIRRRGTGHREGVASRAGRV